MRGLALPREGCSSLRLVSCVLFLLHSRFAPLFWSAAFLSALSSLVHLGAVSAQIVSLAFIKPYVRSMNSLSKVGVFRAISVMKGLQGQIPPSSAAKMIFSS